MLCSPPPLSKFLLPDKGSENGLSLSIPSCQSTNFGLIFLGLTQYMPAVFAASQLPSDFHYSFPWYGSKHVHRTYLLLFHRLDVTAQDCLVQAGETGMPKARKSRAGVKRSKTYVGCWTCRSRRVKCDAVRPTCNRCARGNHFCEGYGIRLVWDRREGEAQNPKGKGRLLFTEADRQNPAFNSDSEIDCALEQLDSVEVGFGFELGPYTVFRANFQEGNTGDSLDSDDSQILSHDDGSVVCLSSGSMRASFLCLIKPLKYRSGPPVLSMFPRTLQQLTMKMKILKT